MTRKLSEGEKQALLQIARDAITSKLKDEQLPSIDLTSLSPALRKKGASFVTLKKGGMLRGCVGTLEAKKPLVEDVRERAVAAAFQDFRFPPLHPDELSQVKIEISVLTEAVPVSYRSAADLVSSLTPGLDGVVLSDGFHRATFLPQVWDKFPEPEAFLSRLCAKMGLKEGTWRDRHLDVSLYRVEKFRET